MHLQRYSLETFQKGISLRGSIGARGPLLGDWEDTVSSTHFMLEMHEEQLLIEFGRDIASHAVGVGCSGSYQGKYFLTSIRVWDHGAGNGFIPSLDSRIHVTRTAFGSVTLHPLVSICVSILVQGLRCACPPPIHTLI